MLLIVEWYRYASLIHYSLLHAQAIWYRLLLLGYKPVQNVIVLTHHHHHHHHISFMELGHLLTHSGLTYPEVSSLSGFFP